MSGFKTLPNLLLGVVLLTCSVAAPVKSNSCESACFIGRVKRLVSADCFNKTCREVPQNLPSDVEALDLSMNRLRTIEAKHLRPYDSLQYLYLSDNSITNIQPKAFDGKTSLVALDISLNSFSSPSAVPEVIFQLPSLKMLYLSENRNINMAEVIERAVPITAPLEYVDLSHNNLEDEEYMYLPNMGRVPTLIKYNVTGMNLILNTSQFAGLCNLQIFVNENVTVQFVNPCDCWSLNKWLHERKVLFKDFGGQCIVKQSECEERIPEEDMDVFTSCKVVHAEQIYQSKLNKGLLIGGCVLGIVLIVFVILVWKRRRTKVRQRREKLNILHHEDVNLNST